MGTITIESESGHCYVADLSWVKKLWQSLVEEKKLLPVEINDPRGNILISQEGKEVEVVLISPVDGRPLLTFKGKPEKVLEEIVQKDLLLEASHWAYFGAEMEKVKNCIKNNLFYIQDKV